MLGGTQISSKCFETEKSWLVLQCDQQVLVCSNGSKLSLKGRWIKRGWDIIVLQSVENMVGITQTSSKCFDTQKSRLILQRD